MLLKHHDEFYSLSFKIERKSANKLTHSSCSILKGPFGEAKKILETEIYTGGYYLVGRANMDIFILSMEIWYVKKLELVSSLSLALCSILLHVHVS